MLNSSFGLQNEQDRRFIKIYGAFRATGYKLNSEAIGFIVRMTILIHNKCPEKKSLQIETKKKNLS